MIFTDEEIMKICRGHCEVDRHFIPIQDAVQKNINDEVKNNSSFFNKPKAADKSNDHSF